LAHTGNLKTLLAKWTEGGKAAEEALVRRLAFRVLCVAKPIQPQSKCAYSIDNVVYAFISEALLKTWQTKTGHVCKVGRFSGQELCKMIPEGFVLCVDSGEPHSSTLTQQLIQQIAQAEIVELEDDVAVAPQGMLEAQIPQAPEPVFYNEVYQDAGGGYSEQLQAVHPEFIPQYQDRHELLTDPAAEAADPVPEQNSYKMSAAELFAEDTQEPMIETPLVEAPPSEPPADDGGTVDLELNTLLPEPLPLREGQQVDRQVQGEAPLTAPAAENENKPDPNTEVINFLPALPESPIKKLLRTWSEITDEPPTVVRPRPMMLDSFGKTSPVSRQSKPDKEERSSFLRFLSNLFS
jgi:hypothetical protein